MRLALALFGLLLLSMSCSPATSTSCASSCTGCCDAKGVCQAGSSNLECGAAGATCAGCMLGASCVFGVCQTANTTGGGTGSTGGGNGSTGGGSGSTGGGTASGGGMATGGGTGNSLIPNVMLLIDTSGSMLLPANPADSNCPLNCGGSSPCPSNCPTRISTLRAALSGFLTERGGTLRLGLTTYPTGSLCQSSATPSVNLPVASASDVGTSAALTQNAASVNTALQNVMPVGGTPTADALRGLASLNGLTTADGRADYVVLVTDGLPNCNMNNTNSLCTCGANSSCTTTQVSACNCTTSSCTGTLCSLGCLDSMGAVSAVTQLQTAGIKTVVIGFGADAASSSTAAVLDAMARAGGAPRLCGGSPCAQASYSATTTTELQTVLTGLF